MSRSDRHRARRGRNWALLAALVAFVVIVYLVTVAKLGGF